MKDKQRVMAKVKLGLSLTEKEKALYVLISKKIDLEVLKRGIYENNKQK